MIPFEQAAMIMAELKSTLDPPATSAELLWWRNKRRLAIRRALVKAGILFAIVGVGVTIRATTHTATSLGAWALPCCGLFVVFTVGLELRLDCKTDIRFKRASDAVEEYQARFLELLDTPEEPA